MRLNLITRRQEMVKHLNMGLPLNQVVDQLTAKYGVTENAVYKDWRNRKRWISDLIHIGDPEAFWLDVMVTHREIKRLATLEYLQGDNSNAKIGALRLLRDLNLDLADLMENYDYERRLQKLEATA